MKSILMIIALLFSFGAGARSNDSQKYSLIVFEGSDWCPGCIRLSGNILKDTAFIAYLTRENIRLIEVDFPQKRKLGREQESENERMAGKYHFDGTFPTIFISRTDTLLYEKIYYRNQPAEEFIAIIRDKLQILK